MTTKSLYTETKPAPDAGLSARPGQVPPQRESTAAPEDGIAISEAAAKEIKRQREKRGTPDVAIRVGLRGGGCTGFSYVFDWDDGDPRDNDRVFAEHGVRVYVDSKSLAYLRGTELDFVTSIMGHGFTFNNPNAKGTCGCGESVQF